MYLYKFKRIKDSFPLVAVICILPFVVFGYIYEYTDESYGIFLEGEILSDFFSHTRALVFELIGLYMTYRLVSDFTQGRIKRPCFAMTAGIIILEVCLLLSSLLALNKNLAFLGGYQRFEGCFVKTFYLILAIYTYYAFDSQSIRKKIWIGYLFTAALESLVGFAQMLGHDPFSTAFVQNLILPYEYEGSEVTNILSDNRVYLTLANPNYASIYLAVSIILITYSLTIVKRRGYLIGLTLLDILCFAELIATRSRVGVLMLIVSAVVWVAVSTRFLLNDKKKIFLICEVIFLMLIAGIMADMMMGIGMWDRIKTSISSFGQDRRNCSITDLKVDKYAVKVNIGKEALYISFGDSLDAEHLVIQSNHNEDLSMNYNPKTGFIRQLSAHDTTNNENSDEKNGFLEHFENIRISVEDIDQEPMILIEEKDITFYFAYDTDLGYMIYAGNGYYDTIEDIPHINMHGLESVASGRGYIWSRTIPLISGYRAFTGWGSDNYYLAYPQNDYLGKAQYSSSPYTIIEKPHNSYLLYCVENGVLAMAALILLIVVLVYRCLKSFKNTTANELLTVDIQHSSESLLIALLIVAFAVAFIFNDSSVVISPLFWISLGAGYRITDSVAS